MFDYIYTMLEINILTECTKLHRSRRHDGKLLIYNIQYSINKKRREVQLAMVNKVWGWANMLMLFYVSYLVRCCRYHHLLASLFRYIAWEYFYFMRLKTTYKNARKNLVRDQIQSVPYARGAERNYQVTYFFNYSTVGWRWNRQSESCSFVIFFFICSFIYINP